jgi:hypothetical protein
MQTIHKLRHIDLHSALRSIYHFIEARLLLDMPAERDFEDTACIRLEKAIVTYLFFITADAEPRANDGAETTTALLNMTQQRTGHMLSAKATHAAQTLIWKKAGAVSAEASEAWCLLLQHGIFDGAGLVNKARIGRSVIL